MAMSVQTNMGAVSALKNMNTNSIKMNMSLERLSSGFRINSAADDAAGYAISAKLAGEKGKLEAASQNSLQATSMVRSADAGINEIENMVRRLQVLATQAASANNSGDIAKLNNEATTLTTQIDKLANSTTFNGVNLLNGIDSGSAAVAGAKATVAPAAITTAADGVHGLAITTDAATFSQAATFTVNQNAAGLITSITSDVDLTSIVDGTSIATAGTNLLSAAQIATPPAIGLVAIASIGISFTTVVATANPVATTGSASAAAVAGTDAVAAGASAFTTNLSFQVGGENNTDNQVAIDFSKAFTTAGLAITGDVSTAANAKLFITELSAALDTLTTNRAALGSSVNQLAYVSANLATSIEQMSSAISTIKDADMAAEMANFTKSQVMVQAGTAMLAQANQASQNVLSLFR